MFDARIGEMLAVFPAHVVRYVTARTEIVLLSPGQLYADVSPVLRKVGANVDAWPVPPAGLFVVAERTMYVRDVTPMSVVHEFGHALDCALGGGYGYRSSCDARFGQAFEAARGFVTPYAAVGLDEYFAESARAWVGVNDERSSWPAVSRERLMALDPVMHDLIVELFAECPLS